MSIYAATLTLPGSLLLGENPQPRFGAAEHHIPCKNDGSLLPEETARFGDYCGARVLPYRLQDRYLRGEEPVTVDTVVLENERLSATFLPGFGGRLYSLYSKEEGRELLFKNPVLRPANLAIRNAWLAGGIEWNLGHYGHTALTCESLYCTVVEAEDGEQFLRFYEYEAMKAQLLQLDFHLPRGAAQLGLYLSILNARSTDAPLYWWTNTAVPRTPGTRVFSGSPEVVFQRGESLATRLPTFGHARLPQLPDLPGVDVSYPSRIPYSTEYFFQNPKTAPAPWETASEADGKGFFERSTQPLFARKLFCWGMNPGGRHWQDYLSRPGEGDYVEIQAGLAPTQLHTAVLPGGGCVAFAQFFGAFTAPPQAANAPWEEAQPLVAAAVERALPAAQLLRLEEEYRAKAKLPGGALLHRGGCYGALELARREKAGEPPLCPWLYLPEISPESSYAPWLTLLQEGILPAQEGGSPPPYLTDPAWLPLLEASMERPGGDNPTSRFLLGVLLGENGRSREAKALFQRDGESAEATAPWALHAWGLLELRDSCPAAGAELLLRAVRLEQGRLDPSFREAAMEALLPLERYQEIWALFEELPQEQRTQRQQLAAAQAAVKLGHWDFLEWAFEQDYAAIREGAAGLSEVWLEYQARRAARKAGVPFQETGIDRSLTLPYRLNFRMLEQ